MTFFARSLDRQHHPASQQVSHPPSSQGCLNKFITSTRKYPDSRQTKYTKAISRKKKKDTRQDKKRFIPTVDIVRPGRFTAVETPK
jgi:hypothetical protein